MRVLSASGKGDKRKVAYQKPEKKAGGGGADLARRISENRKQRRSYPTRDERVFREFDLDKRYAIALKAGLDAPEGSARQEKALRVARRLKDQRDRFSADSAATGKGEPGSQQNREFRLGSLENTVGLVRRTPAGANRDVTIGSVTRPGANSKIVAPRSIAVRAPYNEGFIAAAKAAGGKWDPSDKVWVFESTSARKKVARLVRESYGATGKRSGVEMARELKDLAREGGSSSSNIADYLRFGTPPSKPTRRGR